MELLIDTAERGLVIKGEGRQLSTVSLFISHTSHFFWEVWGTIWLSKIQFLCYPFYLAPQ